MKWGLALLRWIVGATFMAHGAQKLFGWFGGYGPEGTGQFFESNLQLAPGKRNAVAAGVAEFGGGALLVAGAAVPLATSALCGTMTTAIWKVHKDKGFFANEGGYEFNLVLMAALVVLADEGPGALSLGPDEGAGPFLAFLSVAAGAAGGFAVIELGRSEYEKRYGSGGGPATSAQDDGASPAGQPAAASASA